MKVWNNPQVKSTVDDVQTQARQTAHDAKSKVTDKVKHHDPDPASDTYRPGDEVIGPPPVPGGSVIADAAHDGTS